MHRRGDRRHGCGDPASGHVPLPGVAGDECQHPALHRRDGGADGGERVEVLDLDKSDVQGAGGYHEETHGVPDLKVFARSEGFGASCRSRSATRCSRRSATRSATSRSRWRVVSSVDGGLRRGRGRPVRLRGHDRGRHERDGVRLRDAPMVERRRPAPYDYKRHISQPMHCSPAATSASGTRRPRNGPADRRQNGARVPPARVRNARLGDATPRSPGTRSGSKDSFT